ncbi:MAG: hypothetical protein NC338_02990 [Firmicutes bacterium]|nr:hypothetical protein [Bacillota bacterium]MCM1401242.1 hypothetical protein [Bacteroides sp.]MCM1477209.1 hypothetical protein [Bacteroides sp.]
MKYFNRGLHPLMAALLVGAVSASCVDNDYDLAKDVDLTVNVGGDLTLPSSSTERYTLSQILDLSSNSSIKPVGAYYGLAQGDYVLLQNGNRTNSTVNVPTQTLNDITCASSSSTVNVVSTGTGQAVSLTLPAFSNSISIKDANIDKAVKSISNAVTDIRMNFSVSVKSNNSVSGNLTFQPGFTLKFPESWTVKVGEGNMASYLQAQGNKIVFSRAYSVSANSSLTLPIVISNVDFTKLPADQGLYAPGKFSLEDDIQTSGPITFTPGNMAAGQSGTITFEITPSIPYASIREITGSIDPVVTVSPTVVTINDIPSFLKEPGNNLDIDNPMLKLTVYNGSPVELNLNCRLMAKDSDGKTVEVWIGNEHGTDPITINGSGLTVITVSRLGRGGEEGSKNVAVPNLSTLIETIPETITLDNIKVKVPANKEYTFVLGSNYDLQAEYQAIIPLAFGPDLQFSYTTDEAGWDEDLSKYSFKEAVATVDVVSSAPLELTPEVIALDRNGNEISDITVSVEGQVAPGSIALPSTSTLKVNLRSNAANIGNLDGVRFTFKATCPPGFTGTPLNENQSVKFTNIRLKLIGGVGVDLN